MHTNAPDSENFRDQIATADKFGRRIWVYPIKPKGDLYRWRTIVSWFLLALLFSGPFIKIGGYPILQLNIIERQFYLFGLVFWPQDLHLFVLATITMAVFVVLFTAVFGRLFCGWVCPQTIFLEMVFRKIERLLEGDGPKQKAFDRRAMSANKFFRKTLKHTIFLAISFLIGNTFLAYIIGSDQLLSIITDPPAQHLTGLSAMIIFTLIFYWIFAFFREQVCTLVCPYGRLQSVLLDNNSIVVAYDYNRGETRGPLERGGTFDERGDCIDCAACIKVCPTGIDIRNGTQLECINCTACIDACNRVMKKMSLPSGLIRYSSENRLSNKSKKLITGRVVIYSAVLSILLVIVTTLMASRSSVETTILRTPGQLYVQTDEGIVRNLYSMKIVNKSYDQLPIQLSLKHPEGSISIVGPKIVVPPGGMAEAAFFVDIDASKLFVTSSPIEIEISTNGELLETIRTSFNGPSGSTNTRDEK